MIFVKSKYTFTYNRNKNEFIVGRCRSLYNIKNIVLRACYCVFFFRKPIILRYYIRIVCNFFLRYNILHSIIYLSGCPTKACGQSDGGWCTAALQYT